MEIIATIVTILVALGTSLLFGNWLNGWSAGPDFAIAAMGGKGGIAGMQVDKFLPYRAGPLLKQEIRTIPGRELHLFSDFPKCAYCSMAFTRKLCGKHVYYACSICKSCSKMFCTITWDQARLLGDCCSR